MLKVSLHTSSLTHRQALSTLISSLGYEVTNGTSQAPQVAVWSLHSHPFPKPCPGIPNLAILTFADDKKLIELLNLGYRGYHLPDSAPEQLKKAIQTVYEGEAWIERRIMAQVIDLVPTPRLTPRQLEVMQLLRAGKSNKQIAAQLGVAEKTVKAHVSAILEKFGAKNRIDLLLNSSGALEGL